MKHLLSFLAVALASALPSFADEVKFKITTYHLDAPGKELPEEMKSNRSMTDDQFQSSMRALSQLKSASVITFPTITLHPNKQGTIEIVTEQPVRRLGDVKIEKPGRTVTYLLTDIDGAIRLQGVYNQSEIDGRKKAGVVTTRSEEIIFDMECKPDMILRVSTNDTHLLIKVTPMTNE
jgi:hypothetical protein